MNAVSSSNLAIIGRVEEDHDHLDDALEFAMLLRRLAQTARGNSESLNGMVSSMQDNARMSRVLRPATRRIISALDQFNNATEIVDEWDRRLQALGVPVPAEDWEPSLSSHGGSGLDSDADQAGSPDDW